MGRNRVPGTPTPRALAAKEIYLSLGPGRTLQKCLDVIQKRAQIANRPPICTRLATIALWSRRDHWVEGSETNFT